MGFIIANLHYLPVIFIPIIFFLAVFSFFTSGVKIKKYHSILIYCVFLFYFFYSGAETLLQYLIWASGEPGKFFLPPFQPLGYFSGYSFTHFWLTPLISAVFSSIFYFFLRYVGKNRTWLFDAGEQELGYLMALMTGWPGVVLFVPLVFAVMLPYALFRRLALKEERTTLGMAFLLAGGVVIVAGGWLAEWLGLEVLRL